ncbi:Uncharacterised protein [Vibrio cholerae]|nr:Uncharacterised protein [Vibrio cholerae]CSI67260.1 Uncharacterised protein [Vibrio cholerae]CSI85973.1 Uncharacterised protein [Vibrio cholerae]
MAGLNLRGNIKSCVMTYSAKVLMFIPMITVVKDGQNV